MAKDKKKKINPKALLVFLLGVFALYSQRLHLSPVHLNQDEMMFALNAESIVDGGVDYYGNSFPFYFWHLNSFWATPIIVYLTALVLKVLPLTEATIRLSSVLVGVSVIGLIMVLVDRLFKDKRLTMLSGLLAATTPVLFIHSRVLLDNLYPVPFVLLWLLFTHRFFEKGEALNLFFAGLSLGVGFHSYHAAKIYMPLYFVITILFLVKIKRANFESMGKMLLGFLIPIILFIPWLQKHPDTLLNQVSYIGLIDGSVDVSKGVWGVFNKSRLEGFLINFVSYFNPKYLFIEGDRSLIHSTGGVGAFLFPVVFFLGFGFFDILLDKKKGFEKLFLFGFLTYPLAPAIVNDPQRISRGLVVIPFVVLVSVYGINFLTRQGGKVFKLLVVALFALGILEFGFFLNDYFGGYRVRSASWFNNDIGRAMESALVNSKTREVKKIYLDRNILFAENYFDFYMKKTSIIPDQPVNFFDSNLSDFSGFESGSLVVLKDSNLSPSGPQFIGAFEKIEAIREPNGIERYFVYYRDLNVE